MQSWAKTQKPPLQMLRMKSSSPLFAYGRSQQKSELARCRNHDLLKDPHLTLTSLGFRDLPLTLSHARLGGLLSHPHKDPFDRMLAAQALLESLTLVSVDTVFDDFAVARLW